MITVAHCETNKRCFFENTTYHGSCEELCNSNQVLTIINLKLPFKLCDDENSFCCISDEFLIPRKQQQRDEEQIWHSQADMPMDQDTVEQNTTVATNVSVSRQMCLKYSEMTKHLYGDYVIKFPSLGKNTELGEFPHMAALGYKNNKKFIWSCAASLISDRFVITSAHCVNTAKIRYVLLGGVALNNADKTNIYTVRAKYVHPSYNEDSGNNDIALVKLRRRVLFTLNIKPACVSPIEHDMELSSTVWNKHNSDHLQTTYVRLYNNSACATTVRNLSGSVLKNQFCAVSEDDTDLCSYSSGGPLQLLHFRLKLHGVVGIKSLDLEHCGTSRVPALYTELSHYVPWIESVVWPTPIRVSQEKCIAYSKKLINETIYGLDDKVVGGRDAEEGEFPHMAALGYGNIKNITWSCGGSLVSDRFVLTAAHCVNDPKYGEVQYVQLGFTRILSRPREGNFFFVEKVFTQEDYHPPSIYNDIALIKLARRVIFNANVKPACLFTDSHKDLARNNSLIATGWGLTRLGGTKSDILQAVELRNYNNCTNFYGVNSRKYNVGIRDSQICAGSTEEKDTCQGDSGGPLQVFDFRKKLHVIMGVTSTGRVCASDTPAIYTKVSNYLDWIEHIVWPKKCKIKQSSNIKQTKGRLTFF